MTFLPDRASKAPLYRQLGDYLIDQLADLPEEGEHPMLTEREMCCAYGVSRATVRQALHYMEERHFITRRQGSGTFTVPQKPITNLMQMYSFTKEMERQGKKPSSRLISMIRTNEYGSSVAERLQLRVGVDEVYVLRRLRYADGVVKMLETSYLPCARLPELKAEEVIENSLYGTLQQRYHIVLDHAVQEFEVTSASGEEAELLGLTRGDPVMLAVRTGYAEEKPVEYSKSIIPRGAMRYRVQLRV